jgi:hypothetical protein
VWGWYWTIAMVDECSVAVEDWRSGFQGRAASAFAAALRCRRGCGLETEVDVDILNTTTKSSICDSESREFRRSIIDGVCYPKV